MDLNCPRSHPHKVTFLAMTFSELLGFQELVRGEKGYLVPTCLTETWSQAMGNVYILN